MIIITPAIAAKSLMKINNPEKRLQMFWGQVDKKHVNIIKSHVKGKAVLDMGCGYGSTTAYLTEAGFDCIGIDYATDAIEAAQKRYPGCDYRFANAEELPFETGQFDTLVLRDALHHFYGEANFEKVTAELQRVCKPNARIIFFDPNVNLLLKTMRKVSSHDDEECDYETALEIMEGMNFKVVHKRFNTVYSLPLSGGYVGLNFVPNFKPLYALILGTERVAEALINALGLGRFLCWRYVIVGDR